jgi:phosphate/sulfate permease
VLAALAVLLGACLWVLLATRFALPVSTTHAITGSLVTVCAFVFGAGNVQWARFSPWSWR